MWTNYSTAKAMDTLSTVVFWVDRGGSEAWRLEPGNLIGRGILTTFVSRYLLLLTVPITEIPLAKCHPEPVHLPTGPSSVDLIDGGGIDMWRRYILEGRRAWRAREGWSKVWGDTRRTERTVVV